MSKPVDLKGKRFGRLTVVEPTGKRGKIRVWKCRCDCGGFAEVRTGNLGSGNSQSCGCLARDRTSQAKRTHGDSRARLYRAWNNMIWRCRPDFKQAKDYAERGISVCNEWKDYEAFKAWALANGYNDDLTLDREDNDGNYEPSNCRWITRSEQQGNRRANNLVEFEGQWLCLTEAARRAGINISSVRKRLRIGWDLVRALSEPVRN